MRSRSVRKRALAGVLATAWASLRLDAQAVPAETPVDTLRIQAEWNVARLQARGGQLTFTLSRLPRAGDGQLVVVVGRSDLSALLDVAGTRVRLPLYGQRLDAGENEVRAYLARADGSWLEIGRFPLRLLDRAGFESLAMRPKLDVQSSGQLHGHAASAAPPSSGRPDTYQDLALNGGVDGTLSRDGWSSTVQGLVAGATREQARLRAAQLGPRAPEVDLASYAIHVTHPGVGFDAGHLSLGDDRLLVSQFRSRGMSATVTLPHGLQLGAAGTAGSEIVGWDDPLGIARPSHRLLVGTIGFDAVPSRPGMLRLAFSTIDGARQPTTSFQQSAVTDREESRGTGVQVTAADPSGRTHLTLGAARSRFINPTDSALSGGATLVAVRPESRGARFGELRVDVLRGAQIGPAPTTLAITARHQRVDPQYRSIGATLQADRDEDALETIGSVDALQLQYAVGRARDNLAQISSLLTTRTHTHSLNAALPLGQLLRTSPGTWWWPQATASWMVVDQRGDSIPPNSGFRLASQVPNQHTGNLTTALVWQRAAGSLSLHLNRAGVDNRLPGGAATDLVTDVAGATLALTLSPSLTLGTDLSSESVHDVVRGTHAETRRVGAQGDWRPVAHTTFAGTLSLAGNEDPAATRRAHNVDVQLEASQGFNVYARPRDGSQARIFVRYTLSDAQLRLGQTLQPTLRQWALNGGFSLRLF
jgi:hypothetical protein